MTAPAVATTQDAIDFDAIMARKYADKLAEDVFTDDHGNPIKQSQIHLDMFDFISANQEGVIELPRESGKTTNLIALAAWAIGQNPETRVKIVSNTDTVANSRIKALREVLESEKYRVIFPHIRPGREWTDARLTVKRQGITPESTAEGYGVHSKVTGGRCDWLFLDDVDDEEVVVSEVKRRRNWDRVSNVWLNLLTPTGRAFAIATPWHEADVIHRLKENGWPSYRRPVVDMTPVWPERWGRDELEAKRRKVGSLAFARGWELQCINSETAPIKGHWFKLWRELPKFTNIGLAVDPNNSLSETADYTAIGVFGVTRDYKVYLLDVIRDHFEFPGLMDTIKKLAESTADRYKMRPFIGVENTAYQKAIPQALKRETPWYIFGLKADRSKFVRASRLAVQIENGRVYLKGSKHNGVDKSQRQVYDECVAFPSSRYVDCVDMLGYGVEMMLSLARKTGAVVG